MTPSIEPDPTPWRPRGCVCVILVSGSTAAHIDVDPDCPVHVTRGDTPGYHHPVTTSTNLPARRDASAGTFGAHDTPLADAPTAALAFALGYAVARPVDANTFGPFCAMVEELMRRASDTSFGSEWEELMSLLPDALARQIGMLYQAQRGQRWARTGHRDPKSGN